MEGKNDICSMLNYERFFFLLCIRLHVYSFVTFPQNKILLKSESPLSITPIKRMESNSPKKTILRWDIGVVWPSGSGEGNEPAKQKVASGSPRKNLI